MRFSSGFGYDLTTKKFTTSDEVWDTHLEAHSKDAHLRYGKCHDYDDLKITVENGVAIGKNSIGLGSATDAKTLGNDENRDARIEDLNFDPENEVFVTLSQDESPLSGSTPPFELPEVSEGSTQRRNQHKRSRAQYEATSSSTENIMEEIKKLINTFDGVHNLLLKRDTILVKRERERSYTTWDVIKEIPNLDEDIRLKDCIGAIDGTHIPAMVPGQEVSSFRNRHGTQSQNVLAACNFDLQFMYVLSGWEGSAHDSRFLNDALSRRNGLHVPQGKYFLVDCGFANQHQFLAPLRGVRNHLKDFGGQSRHPRNAMGHNSGT
ncbi:hypothetical protein C2S52_021272 [Perilla frutescens var. hirtella]|nr:hypothetical protein C2S52_021272 [Perilla frutescens var. hirtella]